MKKLIAMILALSICFSGCANGETETQIEETEMTIATETIEEPTTEVPETTGELTTQEPLAEEPAEEPIPEETLPDGYIFEAQGPLVETEISKFLSQVPTDGTVIDREERLNNGFFALGRALDWIIYSSTEPIKENINYLDEEWQCSLFALEMAQMDPNVQQIGRRDERGAFYYALSEETYRQYYRLLFGAEPSLDGIHERHTMDARIILKDGEIGFYYHGGGQLYAPAMFDNPQFTYENGEYYLRADLQLNREYPDSFPIPHCGRVTICLNKTAEGFQFKSIVLSELDDVVKQDITFESFKNSKYAGKKLSELLAMIADGEPMSKEMKVALQIQLNGYAEPMYPMLNDWNDVKKSDLECNYVESFENRVALAFSDAIDAEAQWDVGVAEDGTITGVTGGLAVKLTKLEAAYQALFGEPLDVSQMQTISAPKLSGDMVYGSYVSGWGCVPPCIKDVYGATLEGSEDQVILCCRYLTTSHEQFWLYNAADELNYPEMAVLCDLTFCFEKAQEGYKLVSLTASESWPS